jgi:hypothetical protein
LFFYVFGCKHQRSAPCHATGSWWKMTITIRLVVAMACAMACAVTSPSLTSPDFQACVRSTARIPALSWWVGCPRLVPALFWVGRGSVGVPSLVVPFLGVPSPASQSAPQGFFFSRLGSCSEQRAFRLGNPSHCCSFLAKLFCHCLHVNTRTPTHADTQTNRQTDRSWHMPCHTKGGVVENLWHAMPCHATMPQWCRPLANMPWDTKICLALSLGTRQIDKGDC